MCYNCLHSSIYIIYTLTFKNLCNDEVVVAWSSYFHLINKHMTITECYDNRSSRKKDFRHYRKWIFEHVLRYAQFIYWNMSSPVRPTYMHFTRLRLPLRHHLILAYRSRCHSRRLGSYRMILCTQARVSCSHISSQRAILLQWTMLSTACCLTQGCPSSWVGQVYPPHWTTPIQ